jgi:hypothetical protein
VTLGRGAAFEGTRRPLLVFIGLSAIAWPVLMVFARETTFRGDDWDLFAGRSLSDPFGLMRPFNEQWVAVPAVIVRLIFAVVGMHSYLPYLGVLLLLHIATAAAIWRIVTTLSGTGQGLAAAAVVLFLGAGYENLYQAFQIGMVLSSAAGLWAIKVLWFDRRPGLAALLLLVSVASHSIGAVFVGVAVLLTLAERRRSNVWLLLPIVALVLWTLVFDLPSLAARGGSFSSSVALLPGFVLIGFTAAVGSVFGSSVTVGVIVLALLAVGAVRLGPRPANPAIALAAIAGLVAEYALVGVSRAELGIGAVVWSRYLYVGVLFVLIAVAAWFGDIRRVPARWRGSAAVALVGLTVVAVLGNLRAYALTNDTTEAFVHSERAAAAVIEWSTDVRQPEFDVHIPPAAELRPLMAQVGGPARDDWFPSLVSPVPEPIAADVCTQMIPDVSLQRPCEDAIRGLVGSATVR